MAGEKAASVMEAAFLRAMKQQAVEQTQRVSFTLLKVNGLH
ncbi:hypothetical protein [Paenibacillus sp. GCM10012306]